MREDATPARARALRREKLSYDEIALRLGVSHKTAWLWVNVDEAERYREKVRRWREREREKNARAEAPFYSFLRGPSP